MSRLSNVWRAITGKSLQPGGRPMAQALHPWAEPPKKGTRELLGAMGTSPYLHVVVDKVGDAVGSTVWQMLTLSPQRRPRKALERQLRKSPPAARRKLLAKAQAAGELVELDEHPVLSLLEEPNPEMSGHDAIKVTQDWLDLKGEAYWVIERNAAGYPAELWPFPPHWVLATPTNDFPFYQVRIGDRPWDVPAGDVIAFRKADPLNPYARGLGLGQVLDDDLDVDIFARKHVKSYFYNRAVPDYILSAEGGDDAQLKQMKKEWENSHRGFWNAFKAFWTRAKVTVTRLDTTFKDMQLSQLRKDVRDLVLHARGIPPEIVGILSNSNRATIEAAAYFFAAFVVDPASEFLRQVLQARLVSEFDDRSFLDYVSPVPEDREFILKVAMQFPEIFRKDELRALTYLPELGEENGGDEFLSRAAPAVPQLPGADVDGLAPGKGGDPRWARRALPPAREKAEDDEVSYGGAPAPADEPSEPGLTESDVGNLLEQLRPERLSAELSPFYLKRVEQWARGTLEALGASAEFDLLNPKLVEHVENLKLDRIKDLVNETTKDELRATLLEGVRAGEDIRRLSDRVGDVFEHADKVRARTIARTEVARSANAGQFEAQAISGMVKTRRWIGNPDERIRKEHLQLHQATKTAPVPLAEPFKIGSASAMYPGGFGVAKLDVNCRCTTAAASTALDDEDDVKSAKDGDEVVFTDAEVALWKAFDAKLLPWEDETTEALRQGFRQQKSDVVAWLAVP